MTSLFDYMIENGIEDADCYDKEVDVGTCMTAQEGATDVMGFVCNYILKNTDYVWAVDESSPHDLTGDFWKFADEHYDQFVRFTNERNREGWRMVDDDRATNLMIAVDVIILLHRGEYSIEDYTRFIEIFDILPEDHVIHKGKVMDIDEMLADNERNAWYPGKDEE